MTRWLDIAEWVGPTRNSGDGDVHANESGDRMVEHRGVVLHIADGYFQGTIAWQRNPASNVSSHFIVARDGRIAQMVDTDIRAWTQRTGNGHWLSVENEGFTPSPLTPQQLISNAHLLAHAYRGYGVPLQIATSPSGRGLGHHSMGCPDWGHCSCPGPAVVRQKSQIIELTRQILFPIPPPTPVEEDSVALPYALIADNDAEPATPGNAVYAVYGAGDVRWIGPAEFKILVDQHHVPFQRTTDTSEINRLAHLAKDHLPS